MLDRLASYGQTEAVGSSPGSLIQQQEEEEEEGGGGGVHLSAEKQQFLITVTTGDGAQTH